MIEYMKQQTNVTRVWKDEYHRNLMKAEDDLIDELYQVEFKILDLGIDDIKVCPIFQESMRDLNGKFMILHKLMEKKSNSCKSRLERYLINRSIWIGMEAVSGKEIPSDSSSEALKCVPIDENVKAVSNEAFDNDYEAPAEALDDSELKVV